MNILLTSVGRRSYLVKYFISALEGEGLVHVANSSPNTPAFSFADRTVVTPLIYDKNYIPFLLDYCRKNQIDALISLFDIDLPIISQNKDIFLNIGVRVLVSDQDVIEICNDKVKTYEFLIHNGFNAPKTFVSLDKTIEALSSGDLSYPVIIKPRWGMGSIGVYEADNDEELKVLYKKTLSSIKNSYLKFESRTNIAESVIIQEKISGQEYGLDVINDLDSHYQNTVVKIKYAMRSGETDYAATVDSKQLKELGASLSNKMRHIGNLDVDVFVVNEVPYVLEMNARFGGGYPFSHMAGVDLPRAIVKWLKGETVPTSMLKERAGIMTYKDINLVSDDQTTDNPHENDRRVVQVLTTEEILNLLYEFDDVLEPSLSSRVKDMAEYSRKLQENALVCVIRERVNLGLLVFYANDSEGKTAYITFLGVHSSAQGKGIGTELLEHCIRVSKENGMNYLKLEVQNHNESAQSFYQKHGFTFSGEASEHSMYMNRDI